MLNINSFFGISFFIVFKMGFGTTYYLNLIDIFVFKYFELFLESCIAKCVIFAYTFNNYIFFH
jgi:hypothetical protein